MHLAFLDLLKAYDSVDRPTLWRKLTKMGFGEKFLASIKKLYEGDNVTCKMNGVTTPPVYLGRGLRQGCSLSPLLFALYVAGLGQDLARAEQGIKLYRVRVSGIFFADDIVLVASTAEGLRELLAMVELHCKDLKMKLSVTKCKVMSSSCDTFEMMVDDEVAGCLDKVLRFRYLGLECELLPARTARAMQERAIKVARKYKACCLRVARDGPDTAEVALALWMCIAKPSLMFGCEATPMSKTAMYEITRQQVGMGKAVLGLPQCAPNVSVDILLGTRPFVEDLYAVQLKFYLRLQQQGDNRWSKDALLDHLRGSWASPYLKHIIKIKEEVGMIRGPVSVRQVQLVVEHYSLQKLNDKIYSLDLPALKKVDKRQVSPHVDESEESQVLSQWIMNCPPLGNRQPRPGFNRMSCCPVCTAPDGSDIKLTAQHVLLDCEAIESARDRLGITKFVKDFIQMQNEVDEAYSAYICGLSIYGEKVSVTEHLQRGKAVKELQEVWLAVWGAE